MSERKYSAYLSKSFIFLCFFFWFLDFGFAHYLLGDTEADILRGSPLYMAPEIVIHRQYNEKADLWSTGVILYGKSFHNVELPFPVKFLAVSVYKLFHTFINFII